MSDKDKRIKVRRSWAINPKTRIKRSSKIYSRRKLKSEIKKIEKEGYDAKT